MNLKPSRWIKGDILQQAKKLGAVAAGCATAAAVDGEARRLYESMLAEGRHGSMGYLEKYLDIRFDPRLILPGALTVISMAFPYRPSGGYHHPAIADYALGMDYHIVLKERLKILASYIAEHFGGQSRPCVDSVPVLERYWAVKSGIGFTGKNGQLIVPGTGSGVFLAELITTLELEPDSPSTMHCHDCGKCIAACPAQALDACGGVDARRCRSYLSIEHRGNIPDGQCLYPQVYGCDECQRVCPHNASEPPEPLQEFRPDPRLLILDRSTMGTLTSGDWRRLTAKSAMKRIPFSQLKRNLNH